MTIIAALKSQVDDKSTSTDTQLQELKSQLSILEQENKWLQEKTDKEKIEFESQIGDLNKEKDDVKEQVERLKEENQQLSFQKMEHERNIAML